MILRSIRLHPFGGTADDTRAIDREVAVFTGPNEAGKSTLRQAIHHVLFTRTDLTPARADRIVGRWYPRPDGDHAEVTLVFEHDGSEWALAKRWGTDARVVLRSAAGATIGDPAAVQAKLAEFLGHNEATSRLVLCTGQAELVRTVELLADAAPDDVPPVADLLQAAAGAAGDVGPERLRAALESTIRNFFGRWDRAAGRPMLDKGRERGVANPWRNDTGAVVRAWYAWRAKVEEHGELVGNERELHGVSAELAELEAGMAADTAFLTTGGPLRDGLGRRRIVALSLEGLQETGRVLAGIAARWPAAQAEAAAARQTLVRLGEQKQKLVAERETARQRAEATLTQAEFDAIVAARTEWQAVERAVRDSFRPSDDAVAELEQVTERIRNARNRIEAQKLAYTIAATEPRSVRISEGTEPPREVAVGGGVSGLAKSRLLIVAGPLSVTVISGEEDVEPLFRALERDLARETELLAACRAASLADVKADLKRHDGLVADSRSRKNVYDSRLRERSFAEWQEVVAAIARLPQTRAVDTITGELAHVEDEIGTELGRVAVRDENVRKWVETYGDQESLLGLLVKNRTQIVDSEAELSRLPTTPTGFATVEEFLAELERREAANRDRPARIKELAARHQQLRDMVGERTAAELAEEAETLQRAFDRLVREGRAYERIRTALEDVLQEEDCDPLERFAARVTEFFRAITAGADELVFEGQLPTRVGRGAVRLETEYLSHGARTALALALRLALAEVHLGERSGFVILDDPFVELDATRRERAENLVRRFATRHQVIFLTCHEPHAAGMAGRPGEGTERP